MTTTLLALFGAITGGIGAASGYYSFLLSGHRIKCQIGFGLRTMNGGLIKFNQHWNGGFGHGVPYIPGSDFIYIQVWNKGRMHVDIEQIQIYQKKLSMLFWMNDQKISLILNDPPIQGNRLPHRIEPGSSATFIHPLIDVIALSKLDLKGKKWDISSKVELGDEKSVESRNRIRALDFEIFERKWKSYLSSQESN